MNIKSNPELFQRILHVYKFDNPLPPDAKRQMILSKKSTLISILKLHGRYSIPVMMVIAVFFRAKKLGIGISVSKSIMVTIMASMIAAGGIGAGAYYIVKLITADRSENKARVIDIQEGVDEKPKMEKAAPAVYSIGLMPLEADDGDKDLARLVTAGLSLELGKIRGEKNIVTVKDSNEANSSKKLLLGSIAKIEGRYMVTVRLVDRQDSRILLVTSEILNSKAGIGKICQKMAGKLAEHIR